MNLQSLTPAQLRRERVLAEAARAQVIDDMIAAGRGLERHSQTVAKSRMPCADELTLRFVATSIRSADITAEENRRLTYRGSLKRTPGN